MSNYQWTVTGGIITSGGGLSDTSVTVTWGGGGTGNVQVNYNGLNGCPAIIPTNVNITINSLPVPSLTGQIYACAGTTGNIYTTDTGMSNYLWTVSSLEG